MSESAPKHRPVNVTLNKQIHELTIQWSDDHLSGFPLNALREACPCALCRGGHEFMGPQYDPNLIELKPARSYDVKDMQLVGNYALQITWSDLHSSGIYTWDYLRRICPCPICTARREIEKQGQA
jgi:DUF971 family protein